MATKLAPPEISDLDPYKFMAVIGKRVIHPGGRASTKALLSRAQITASARVLDVGCGVATTAIEIAGRHGARVTAADISPLMLELAEAYVQAAGTGDLVTVTSADILSLPFDDAAFEVVIAEAVTMFTDRPRAAAELARVTRPGGRMLATEFYWRKPPTVEAREVFLGQVCPGMYFDTVEDWTRIYSSAGLTGLDTQTGPFEMMTPRGFLADGASPIAWPSWAGSRGGPPTPARWPGSCRAWPRPSPTSATSSSPASSPHDGHNPRLRARCKPAARATGEAERDGTTRPGGPTWPDAAPPRPSMSCSPRPGPRCRTAPRPAEALHAQACGALLIDIREDDQRREDGLIPGKITALHSAW